MLNQLTCESWELYMKISNFKFTEKFLVTQPIDRQERLEKLAYARYLRRMAALRQTNRYLIGA